MKLNALTNDGEHVVAIAVVGTDSKFKFVAVNKEGAASLYDSSKLKFEVDVISDERNALWVPPTNLESDPKELTQEADKLEK